MCQMVKFTFQGCRHCFLVPRSHPKLHMLMNDKLSLLPATPACKCEGILESIDVGWNPREQLPVAWCYHCRYVNLETQVDVEESLTPGVREGCKGIFVHFTKLVELLGEPFGEDAMDGGLSLLPYRNEVYALKRPGMKKGKGSRRVRFADDSETIPDVKLDSDPDTDDQAIVGEDTKLYQELATEPHAPLTRLQFAYWLPYERDTLHEIQHFKTGPQERHMACDSFAEESLSLVNDSKGGYMPFFEKDCTIVEVAEAHVSNYWGISPGMDNHEYTKRRQPVYEGDMRKRRRLN